jgi:hypothetical protein
MFLWFPAGLLFIGGCVRGWITRKDKKKSGNLLEDIGYCMCDLT